MTKAKKTDRGLVLHKDVRLGKKPAAPRPRDFKLVDFLDTTQVPPIPVNYGFDSVVGKTAWGMLGNDRLGDCVLASACHQHMVWAGARRGKIPTFTDANAIEAYSAITGYTPSDPNTDQGTDIHDALSYRRHTGIHDANGGIHQIAAYITIDPGNMTQLYQALYLFEAVELGIEFPASAMDQFNAGKPWSVVKGSPIEGGHDIPIFSKQGSNTIKCVTWSELHAMTNAFFSNYCDEAYAIITTDMLTSGLAGHSARGFAWSALQTYLSQVGAL